VKLRLPAQAGGKKFLSKRIWCASSNNPRFIGAERRLALPVYNLSISMEHLPEGMGRVFFFFPKTLIVK
jgi:hypothetical protein